MQLFDVYLSSLYLSFLFSYFPWYLSFLNTITFHYLLICNLSIFLDFHLIFLKLRPGYVISFYFKSIIYFPVPRWSNLGCLKIPPHKTKIYGRQSVNVSYIYIWNYLQMHHKNIMFYQLSLTLSWRRPLSYKNQFFDLLRKSVDWFLYDNGLRHERVN